MISSGADLARCFVKGLGGCDLVWKGWRPVEERRGERGQAEAKKGTAGSTGRPPKLTDAQKVEARPRGAEGATLKELARPSFVRLP